MLLRWSMFALFVWGMVAHADAAPGALVVVGGGAKDALFQPALMEMAGGTKAKILIIPQASGIEGAGKTAEKTFRELGAQTVSILSLANQEGALRAIREADGVWIPGGSQARLMGELTKAGVVEAIRERFAKGLPVGGSSAGAAILSRTMIIGNPDAGKPPGTPPPMQAGLALWPEVIVDQHFSERKRFDRLQNAVITHPKLIGVGIDENTAVIVRGKEIEVMGQGKVQVVAFKAGEAVKPGDKPAVTTLTQGMKLRLEAP